MTTGRINQITTFAERPKTPATVKVYSKQQSFCWLLCKSLRPEGLSMIQAMFFTICVSWDTSFDRVIDTKCRRTSERRASLCRAKHAQTFTTENVCSLRFSFIAYCALKVHIQHFSWSKTPVRVFFQGKSLGPKNSILGSQALIFVKKVLCVTPWGGQQLLCLREDGSTCSRPLTNVSLPPNGSSFCVVIGDIEVFRHFPKPVAEATPQYSCTRPQKSLFVFPTFFSIFSHYPSYIYAQNAILQDP